VRRAALATAAACVVAASAVAGCSGASAGQATRRTHPASYYVSLGDSLSQGVQPDAAGVNVPTSQGYANRLYATLHRSQPWLRLVKLGCSGETTTTMIHGGRCRYPAGSQLSAATDFLRAHRGRISLITIDIGGNDPNSCLSGAAIMRLLPCLDSRVPGTASNLALILRQLRAAAGRKVMIIGMTYYVPELSAWLTGFPGELIAEASVRLAAAYNQLLTSVYQRYQARVADVFGAFRSDDFGGRVRLPHFGTVPPNVAAICQWTWICTPARRPLDQHANAAGYAVIAHAFLQAYRR
jgi:lysophospholipase L1-like esterase